MFSVKLFWFVLFTAALCAKSIPCHSVFSIAFYFVSWDSFISAGSHNSLKAVVELLYFLGNTWGCWEMSVLSPVRREMWYVNFLDAAGWYNSSEIDEMMLIYTLAETTLCSFASVNCCRAAGWINWGVKRLSKESVCRSSAFMQSFKAYLIQFSLPDRKPHFLGEYEILVRFRVCLGWIFIQQWN